ncbi:MAG: hypothetical protein ACKVZ6_16540 [Kineosporiaceae bacterium]
MTIPAASSVDTVAPPALAVRLLRAGTLGVVLFSAAMVVTDVPSLLLGDSTSWATVGTTGDYVGFVLAVTGALTIGWMVLLWWMVSGPVAHGSAGAWAAVVVSVATWFVVDSTASVLRGFPANAAVNVAIVVVCFVPGLWLARPRTRGLYRGGRATQTS